MSFNETPTHRLPRRSSPSTVPQYSIRDVLCAIPDAIGKRISLRTTSGDTYSMDWKIHEQPDSGVLVLRHDPSGRKVPEDYNGKCAYINAYAIESFEVYDDV